MDTHSFSPALDMEAEDDVHTCVLCGLKVRRYECDHEDSTGFLFRLPPVVVAKYKYLRRWFCGEVPTCKMVLEVNGVSSV